MSQLHSLLVAADFSEKNPEICTKAITFAKKLKAEVTLVHAIEYIPYYPYYPYNEKQFKEDCYKEINERMEKLKAIFEKEGIRTNESIIESGKAYDVICKTADKIDACAIVIGVGEHFLLENLVGSTTEKVSRMAKQSVIVINPHQKGEIENVTCAYDFSEHAEATLDSAINIAKMMQANLDVLHVIQKSPYLNLSTKEDEPSLNAVKETLAKATQRATEVVNYKVYARKGKPSIEVCQFADEHDTDLLLIGASGHSALTRLFLGSTSGYVLSKAPCSIMITKLKEA